MNSFKNVRDAIEHEVKRQAAVLDGGGRVVQETRLWDAARAVTQSMRSKEQAHDYRYFPEPDLPPVVVDDAALAALREDLARAARGSLRPLHRAGRAVAAGRGRAGDRARDRRLLRRRGGGRARPRSAPRTGCINEVLARVDDARRLGDADLPVPPAALAALVTLVENGTLSGKLAKDVFGKMWTERRTAADIVAAEGLAQVSDGGELEAACKRVIAAHPDEAARFHTQPQADGLLRRRGHEGDRRQGKPQGGQRDPPDLA